MDERWLDGGRLSKLLDRVQADSRKKSDGPMRSPKFNQLRRRWPPVASSWRAQYLQCPLRPDCGDPYLPCVRKSVAELGTDEAVPRIVFIDCQGMSMRILRKEELS